MSRTLLLSERQTIQKIRRIAHEVLESNFQEEEIVFAGVVERGYIFAEMLNEFFNEISDIPTRLVKISLDKNAPLQSDISLDCAMEEVENKTIVLTDDVLNTGKTLAYSLKPFLNVPIKKLQVAVVVDRGHHHFPIGADFVGYSLSTSLQNHVLVELDKDEKAVYIE